MIKMKPPLVLLLILGLCLYAAPVLAEGETDSSQQTGSVGDSTGSAAPPLPIPVVTSGSAGTLKLEVPMPAVTAAQPQVQAQPASVTSPSVQQIQARTDTGRPDIDGFMSEYDESQTHMLVGAGKLSIGVVQRDKLLGFPDYALGANTDSGLVWRKYIVPVSFSDVKKAVLKLSKTEPGFEDDVLREKVKTRLNRRFFPFAGFNTTDIFYPGAEMGVSYDLSDFRGKGFMVNALLYYNMNYEKAYPTVELQYNF